MRFSSLGYGFSALVVGLLITHFSPPALAVETCSIDPPLIAVSVSSDNVMGNGRSTWPIISADGSAVAFESLATNLVSGDINGSRDVFVYDIQTAQTTFASLASNGDQADSQSFAHALSPDGRYVTFESWARNLSSGAVGNLWDVFAHDRQTGETSRLSSAPGGLQANAPSTSPVISADGHYAAFDSLASNLVAGDENGYGDIFLVDRNTGQTTLISHAADSSQGNENSFHPAMTPDGRYVAFISLASNLVAGDSNGLADAFVYDVQTAQLSRIPMSSNIQPLNRDLTYLTLSDNGRYLAFTSEAANLVPDDTNNARDIFLYDIQTTSTQRVSLATDGGQANGDSTRPKFSADGSYLVFQSLATNLAPDDTNNTWDIFLRDMQSGEITRVSIARDCSSGDGASYYPSISGDGSYVVFASEASNLVPDDTAICGSVNCADIFLAELPFTPVISDDPTPTEDPGATEEPEVTDEPEVTQEPEITAEPTEEPEVTVEPTDEPEVTAEPTVTPVPTETPVPQDPPNIAPQPNFFVGSVILTWSPISWAAQYHVEIYMDENLTSPPVGNFFIGGGSLELGVSNLEPGTYYWRVQAIRVDGMTSRWSTTESFRISG